ncbi:hypothetical protein N7478_010319 [Penicillium angulare]|uniref:uncharacterized protein n=1 Tax=Penicillium angulare TaxID=116970 RepID=UPI0025408C62|nr:uncharacterized protein N7478_010319 [Penicillium angulare]KAJ5267511.1 hypothetical protein N7478_010319 [Penicillium angulare]
MYLLDFPTEILDAIGQHLESQADINALLQSNRRLYSILNAYLYSVNAKFFTGSALLWAVQNNQPQTAHYALRNGVEELLDWDREPLHQAVEDENEAMVLLLLKYGAGVDCKRLDKTPLCIAAKSGHEGIGKLLLQNGAYLESNNSISSFSRYNTPLHVAAYFGQAAIVKLLLENGANIEAEDSDGNTPLFHALYKGQSATLWLLMDHNAKFQGDADSGRALAEAVRLENAEIFEGLLERGADPNAYDGSGFPPLYNPAMNERRHFVKRLVESGADIEIRDNAGRTALSICCLYNRDFAVQILLDCGADPNTKDYQGNTPLHKTATHQRDHIARILIGKGVDMDAVNNDGETPLFCAVRNASEQMVRLLLQHGCDRNVSRSDGTTPLELATQRDKTDDILKLFKDE